MLATISRMPATPWRYIVVRATRMGTGDGSITASVSITGRRFQGGSVGSVASSSNVAWICRLRRMDRFFPSVVEQSLYEGRPFVFRGADGRGDDHIEPEGGDGRGVDLVEGVDDEG